ncbi:hypothetical protein UB31_39450 [Bradyrhizobium sp. LTSP849]|uniref:class I SAM-dependent methyltransferase n=1 Tax=Bradyrhizobium sp. LTSP849 TaxID=1615890 RepID=UPI0005D2C5F2|nr:class I SAM-dependent methyltransferase [Bradyrhizobium sp. LTSP849]KJC34260.1 hypothetical protein UB31_39450 [Bradyrhizobium sp. LTSP849]
MTLSPDIAPASTLELSRAYAADFARSLLRLAFKNVKRTGDVVDSEYNGGAWDRVLNERGWLGGVPLEEFLAGQSPSPRLAKVNGQLVRIATKDYYRYRIRALSELMMRHVGDATSLVELGSGTGYNLFSLSLNPRWTQLRGFDIAPNGIEAGRQIASHYGLDGRVSFDRIDLTDAQDPQFGQLAGATVFTHFCIEQIPYAVDAVIENILRARPGRVVNIEPAIDMLNLSDPRDLASRLYLKSVDYQTRLFALLDELEVKGRIRILSRERMAYAPTLHNDGLLYAWEPLGG